MDLSSPKRPATALAAALLIGLVAAGSYVALATPRLGFHGAFYDELHQAVPAFAWIGRPSFMFSLCRIGGIPLMVMKYKAATEAFLYGSLHLATGHPFTIESWRAFSIGAVALGMLAFAVLARWMLRWWALALVLLLMVLDTTVVLGTRLNWGPVALGLLERLVLVGVFLRGAGKAPGSAWTAFGLGAIVGFATFDKLSSAAIVLPVGLWLLCDGGGRRLRRVLAAIAGGIAGALPLFVINLKWWLDYGRLFSVGEIHGTHEHSASSLLRLVEGCLTLGAGRDFAEEMLGQGPPRWAVLCEGICLAGALAAAAVLAVRSWRTGPAEARLGGLFAASWAAAVAGLYALPELTAHHHWPIAVPFAIVGAALALQGIATSANGRPAGVVGFVLVASVLGLIAARSAATIHVQQHLRDGSVTRKWDPGLNALGRFAASRPEGTGFLAGGWGVANQIFCFSQGRADFVHEVFWDYGGPAHLHAMLKAWKGRDTVYVVALDPPAGPHVDASERIFRDAANVNGWREEALEPELRAIGCVRAKKLVRVPE